MKALRLISAAELKDVLNHRLREYVHQGLEFAMPDTLSFNVLISTVDNAGTSGHEPARNRRYTIVATPSDGGNAWRAESLGEQQYRTTVQTLIPENRDRLLSAITPGNWSPGMIDGLTFSLEEIQGMGLTERRK